MRVRQQTINIMNTLNKKVIDISKLQSLTFNGIPDEVKGLRPIVWRLLLNHLPMETSQWEKHMEQSLATYEVWKDELIIKPTVKSDED